MKKKLTSISDDDTPLDVQIMATQMDDETKANALSKSKQLDRPSSEAGKIKNWLTTLLKIPFGNYISQPVSLSDPPLKIKVLPDLRDKAAASAETFGLDSYITPSTPRGIVTF